VIMAKRNLLGDCVLRRDSLGMLWMMNRQEGGWRSDMLPVQSEKVFLDTYNARLGEWTKDECSEYCLVTALSSEEEPIPDTKKSVIMVDGGGNILVGFSIFDALEKYSRGIQK